MTNKNSLSDEFSEIILQVIQSVNNHNRTYQVSENTAEVKEWNIAVFNFDKNVNIRTSCEEGLYYIYVNSRKILVTEDSILEVLRLELTEFLS